MPTPDLESVLDTLAQAARSDRLLLFLGSGIAAPYGLPTWRRLVELLNPPTPDYRDLPGEFQKYVNRYGRAALNSFLERKLGVRPASLRDSTKMLLGIRSVAIVTTNCDRILETAAHSLGAPQRVTVVDADLEDFHITPWLRLVKLHGSLDQTDTLVFTTKDYDEHPSRVPAVRAKVADLMRYCTVLFLGFSLSDPDFAALMTIVGEARPGNLGQMFGLFSQADIESDWRHLHLNATVRGVAPLRELAFEDFGPDPEAATLAFLAELTQRISPDALPSLSGQTVVFTNGYTATLKSELAQYLSNCLGIHLFATHRYGRCTTGGLLDQAKRNDRYAQMLSDAGAAIDAGRSMILDGTFADAHWRETVYQRALTRGARVIVVKTRCEDEAYIRIRLWRRKLDHSRSDHEVTDIQNFRITRAAIEASPVESDAGFGTSGAEVITFENHGDRSVQVADSCSPDVRIVANLLRLSPYMSTHI